MEEYIDSPVDSDDVFPCKGCGEILEEGKAFELAGNRWHLDCFRCNTCNTLLDSDANLLLLGDGSLICNNCTYSCSACGNKIEDLAILTGDQAFCATCFRCRNCKRKIENLRYARTSQGIFCMSCHESLMARRRKKSKAAAQAKARDKDGSPMIKEKSLPALPPNAIPPNAFSNDRVTPDSETPTELSPRPRPSYPRNDSSRSSPRPAASPDRPAEPALAPPAAASYRNNRNSTVLSGELTNNEVDGFFIPVALDPSPVPSVTPRSASDNNTQIDANKKAAKDSKDYFSSSKHGSVIEKRTDSQSSTPHIAFQEKGRQPSSEYESPQPSSERPTRKLSKRSGQSRASNSAAAAAAAAASAPTPADNRRSAGHKYQSSMDDFKLQDAPKSKKFSSPRNNSQSTIDVDGSSPDKFGSNGALRKERQQEQKSTPQQKSDSPPVHSSQEKATPQSLQEARFKEDDDLRPSIDSVGSSRSEMPSWKAIARKELPPGAPRHVNGKPPSGPHSKPSPAGDLLAGAGAGGGARSAPLESKINDAYMQPRAPPQPPGQQQQQQQQQQHAATASTSSAADGSPKPSPKLPRWSSGGDFSMDEDMARILGTDEGSSSILRRVSHAVRHGRNNSSESSTNNNSRVGHSRSVSENTRATASPRWPKTPIAEDPVNGSRSHEVGSPASMSGTAGGDDPAHLKRRLRTSEQRVAELERQFNSELDLKHLNKKLVEKRKTVSVLDTQTEIMIRQLEVLAGYVERAKETKKPVDPRDLEESAIKEFVQKLESVRQTMAASIEQLLAERDELVSEKNRAVADRDRALLEFEQLSSKNAQLADLNNDLTHQIQERFKSQIGSEMKSPNGLGIYGSGSGKGISTASVLDASSLQTGSTLVNTDVEEPVVEGPTVVNIRKGQVRKFNWKKGSSKVAHNISKGINRAAVAFQQQEQQQQQQQQLQQQQQQQQRPHQGLTGDNIGLPYNMTVTQVESPVSHAPANNGPNRAQTENAAKGFGFFGNKRPVKSASATNVPTTVAIAEAPSTLFGSDLVERADYERRQIPSVVIRCIEEVELRGMDIEGIYRKTGGNSQVKMIQEGFDKNEDFDISDPSMDITAVTSVLKQYFRKLPIPLLTFDVYERVLESNSIQNDAERCIFLRKTINMLPPKHRDCLEFLMFHLTRVAKRERENLMSPKNLAVVFAPTIMRDHSLEKEMTDMHAKNLAVQFIIEQSDTVFSADG